LWEFNSAIFLQFSCSPLSQIGVVRGLARVLALFQDAQLKLEAQAVTQEEGE
jgi:hypothetical protein